jgi:hypothetical protein
MKPITTIVVIFLLLVSLMHILRIVFEFEVTVAGEFIPMWPSIAGCLVTAVLAAMLWWENRSK